MSKEKRKIDFKKLLKTNIKDLKIGKLKKIKKKKVNIKQKKIKVISFDIGSYFIKAVVGTYYKDNLTIENYYKIKTPIDSVVDGEIKKEKILANKLKSFLKENNIKVKYGTCTTNSSLIINREVIIPKVEEDELETVVRYEIQQYLPINLDDYIIQVKIINEIFSDEGIKLNIRAIAYPNKLVIKYYNLLKEIDLKPHVLDVNYNSVNKFINYIGFIDLAYKKQNVICMIDLGYGSINVNIYKNGQIDFTRIIKSGGKDMETLLSDNDDFHVYIKEAKIENDNFICIGINEYLANEVKEIIDEWLEKIEKIINYYNNKNLNNKIDCIYIFGGASNINGFEKYFSDKLGINTNKVTNMNKSTFNSHDDGNYIDEYINAIGALIRNY